jgi:hypothetical protein
MYFYEYDEANRLINQIYDKAKCDPDNRLYIGDTIDYLYSDNAISVSAEVIAFDFNYKIDDNVKFGSFCTNPEMYRKIVDCDIDIQDLLRDDSVEIIASGLSISLDEPCGHSWCILDFASDADEEETEVIIEKTIMMENYEFGTNEHIDAYIKSRYQSMSWLLNNNPLFANIIPWWNEMYKHKTVCINCP